MVAIDEKVLLLKWHSLRPYYICHAEKIMNNCPDVSWFFEIPFLNILGCVIYIRSTIDISELDIANSA